ncbi:MAG: acyl-CoA reductase [Pseudomonadota bacterium]|nr:acyl-CoA reductase [Pseudomonadota bacterium]
MSHLRYLFGEVVVADKPLSVKDAEEICRRASLARSRMNSYPNDKVLALLGRVQKLWADKNSNYRRRAMDKLPELTGFSLPMLELGMQELVWSLDPEVLKKKLDCETQNIPKVYGEKFNSENKTLLRYYPIGTVFHVLSGNVFLVGPGSLIEGLITGNVNILKMPSEERFFLPWFLESLKECDIDGVVSSSIAAIDFSSSQQDVLDTFKNQMDGIVIWGGEQAVQGYRNGAPARTRIIVFGPKLSFSLVTKKGVEALGISRIALEIAKEIIIWDQQACTAPQACYVEGSEIASLLLDELKVAMAKLEVQYPAGSPSRDSAVEIRKLRGIAEIREGLGAGKLVDSGHNNLNYTFFSDNNLELDPSPLNRTLRIVPFSNINDVLESIKGLRGYLQTVGVAVGTSEWGPLVHEFSMVGGLRILPLGSMALGEIDDPHDGQYDLAQYLNLVVARGPLDDLTPFDVASDEYREALRDQKLREMLAHANKSPFYQERLKNISIQSLKDLHKIPVLSRLEWENNMPPMKETLATTPPKGGYVTRSGGSTGVAKFSYFDKRDWNAMLKSAVKMFQASGLSSEDRIANFMSAGDLYGSFISFNHVNFELGATSYCFAGATDPQNFLNIVGSFKINVIQGITPVVMNVLRGAKSLDPSFEIEKVLFAGMPMCSADRKWIKTELKAKSIVSIIGTTESNHIGYQCEFLEGRFHHIPEDYNHIEIIGGRLIVTNLDKWNYPVIRYDIGDAGKFTETACACGRKDRVFEYFGRCDDLIATGMMNLSYSDLVKALAPTEASQIQIIIGFKNNIDNLTINIESGIKDKLTNTQVTELLDAGLTDFSLFRNKYFGLEINILKPGTLKLNDRTGKVSLIIDER